MICGPLRPNAKKHGLLTDPVSTPYVVLLQHKNQSSHISSIARFSGVTSRKLLTQSQLLWIHHHVSLFKDDRQYTNIVSKRNIQGTHTELKSH